MKKLLAIFAVFCFGFHAFTQTPIADNDINNGKALIEAYLSPFGKSLGAGLNNGWWNTAKPHSLGGFDVTFTINTVLIPDEGKSFNVNDIGSGSFTSSSSSAATPTFVGSDDGLDIIYNNALAGNPNFEMPGGTDMSAIPLPMLQAGVGLIKNTEIDIRYIPQQSIGSIASINLFGLGIKHDVLQWIPMMDKLPIDVSIQAGFTKLKAEFELQGQDVELDVRATTFNLLVSKKFAMLTGYAGLGYNSSTTTFKVVGDYAIGTPLGSIKFDADDLTELKFESQNNFRANLGLRFQLAVLAIQANYTFSEYPVATVGIGISIR